MAEVLRAINLEEMGQHPPARELLTVHQREAEEAVAEDLDFTLKMGCPISGGDMLVRLNDGRSVSFSFALIDEFIQHNS